MEALSAGSFEALIHPFGREEFLRDYWPQKHLVMRGSPARFPTLDRAPELENVFTLLRAVQKAAHPEVTVQAWFRDEAERHQQIHLSAADAEKLYRLRKVTIVVNRVHWIVPAIDAFLKEIAPHLETPQLKVSCNAYASPKGKGTRLHFDSQENFLVQLRGKKRWTIAPNQELPFPINNYAGEAPARLVGAQKITLAPGSVLFLPRGYWHEAHTIEDALGLTFTYQSKNWIDLLVPHLLSRLPRQEQWRMPAAGALASGERRQGAQTRLRALLKELAAGLESIELSELLSDQNRQPFFQKNPQARLNLTRPGAGTSKAGHVLEVGFSGGSAGLTMDIEAKYLPFIRWLVSRGAPFSMQEARSALGRHAELAARLPHLLGVLKGQRVLV